MAEGAPPTPLGPPRDILVIKDFAASGVKAVLFGWIIVLVSCYRGLIVEGGPEEVGQGLRLTGFFLERFVFAPHDRPLPRPRRRLAERFPQGLTAVAVGQR